MLHLHWAFLHWKWSLLQSDNRLTINTKLFCISSFLFFVSLAFSWSAKQVLLQQTKTSIDRNILKNKARTNLTSSIILAVDNCVFPILFYYKSWRFMIMLLQCVPVLALKFLKLYTCQPLLFKRKEWSISGVLIQDSHWSWQWMWMVTLYHTAFGFESDRYEVVYWFARFFIHSQYGYLVPYWWYLLTAIQYQN